MRISDWSSDVCSSDLAARLSFTAVGFSATTIERVASQSGTTPRSVMHRFADKDALLYAVVDRWLSARLADILAPAATLKDPMERLRGVCREMQIGRESCRERVCQYV